MSAQLPGLDLVAFLAVFARVSAWATTAPYIGDAGVPRTVRAAACVVLALALHGLRAPMPSEALWLALPGEILVGLLAGFAARLAIAGAEAGGQLIGLQLELGFASTMDPLMREESLPTRRIAYALAGIAFLSTGGLESTVRLLSLPTLVVPAPGHLLAWATAGLSTAMQLGVSLSAPVLCAGAVANLSMALASRAAPALNVFSVVLACVLVLGGTALHAGAPLFVRELHAIARAAAEAPTALLGR